jgi:hypothetical protein
MSREGHIPYEKLQDMYVLLVRAGQDSMIVGHYKLGKSSSHVANYSTECWVSNMLSTGLADHMDYVNHFRAILWLPFVWRHSEDMAGKTWRMTKQGPTPGAPDLKSDIM